jgi:hypothetical protein
MFEAMAEPKKTGIRSESRVRSSSFKYYIHDASQCCRLQLIGELTEFDIAELTGCAQTARTILGGRPLVLDVEKLKVIDEVGRQWIAAMVADGAVCRPESFLRDRLAGDGASSDSPTGARPGIFAKLFSALRGSRAIATE